VQILGVIAFLFCLSCSIGNTTLCREAPKARTGSGFGALLRQEADQVNICQKRKQKKNTKTFDPLSSCIDVLHSGAAPFEAV
jgi:hypothetical protein